MLVSVTLDTNMGEFWVVAKTKPQKELWASQNVTRQGFTCYLPRVYAGEKKGSSKPKKPQFLFPRYLFVLTEGRWRCLLGTFGIAGLIMHGDRPAVMSEVEVLRLRRRESSDGLIRLPKSGFERFKAGDTVRVTEGSFSGYSGIYESHSDQERVQILLDFLGRKTRVLIGEESLEHDNG